VGFDADRMLSVPLQQLQGRFGSDAAVLAFSDRLLATVKNNPAVAGAAMAWPFDYTGFTWAPNVNLPDRPFEPGREPVAQTAAVTPGYFQTMGIPLIRGRDFGPDERTGAPPSVILNQTFVSRFFAGEDPLGKRVSAMRIPQMQNMTVIGIVGDTRRGGMLMGFTPELYIAYAQFPQSGATLVVRAAGGDPLALSSDVKSRVGAVDSSVAVGTVRRVSDRLAQTYGDRRALSWLLSVFAALALGLTVLGIASVVSFTVAQRVPEIGVRIALGANRADVMRLIVVGSLYPVVAGALAGLLALIPLSRVFKSYLFGISPADPASLAAVAVVLLFSAIAAAYVPARRASSIDPLTALRST
jgi:putative ABC transport system permease protein